MAIFEGELGKQKLKGHSLQRPEAEEPVLEDLTIQRLKKRKIETKQIVAKEIRKDEQIQKNIKLAPYIGPVWLSLK